MSQGGGVARPGGEVHEAVHHPGPITYVKIAAVLAIITIVEVGLYYLEWLGSGIIVPALIVLSTAKFILVVMYYMHLKFDHKIFTGIFLWGLFLAVATMLGMMAMYAAFAL